MLPDFCMPDHHKNDKEGTLERSRVTGADAVQALNNLLQDKTGRLMTWWS